MDGPASRRKFVFGIKFLGASRWPPQIVIRYLAGTPCECAINNNACDICGQPASVHMTEIHDGQKVERHLCAEHTDANGIKLPAPGQMLVNGVPCSTVEEATTRGILDNLRGTSNFAHRHGRMPVTVEELQEGMSLPDDIVGVEITDPELRAQLKWVDGLIAFCRAHGRMPQTLDEMPPAPSTG